LKVKSVVLVIVLSILMVALSSCADKNLRQGKILLKQNPPNYKDAIVQFQKSLKANPQNAEPYFYMGKSYAALDNFVEMDKAFAKALELNPAYEKEINGIREQKWASVFNKGLVDTKKKDYKAALEKFETCMIIDPGKYESYSNAGFVAVKLNDDKKAYEYNKKAYEMKKGDYDILKNFAAVCFRQGKYDEALKLYDEAEKLEPNNTNIPIRVGQIYNKMGDSKKEAEAYEQALKIDPQNPNLWFNLGVLYLEQLKDLPNAERSFAQAMKYNPDDTDAAFNRILVLVKLKEYQKAVPIIKQLEQKDPNNCDIYDVMASVYVELGDKKMVNEAISKGKKCRGEK